MSAPSKEAAPAPAGGARAGLRRERLINAAEAVFTRDGLRGASMERIAAEAGVARATVYAYFTDKEHAFLLVSQRLAQRLEASFTAALAGGEAPKLRVRRAILAKYELIFQVARLSPHAADLLAAKDRLAGPVFAAAEARILAALQAELAALHVANPTEATAILFAAAKGVADACPDLPTLQSRLTSLTDAVLTGLSGPQNNDGGSGGGGFAPRSATRPEPAEARSNQPKPPA